MIHVPNELSSHFILPPGITYFDSAASSLTAKVVLERMQDYYSRSRANIHRGEHRLTRAASESYESVYETLARFFHASPQEFTSVRNTTEGINGVALGIDWKAGDEVIVSDIEHHSNLLPWMRLREKGVRVKVLSADGEGMLSPKNLSPLLSKKTRLVALSACSNVLGAKEPLPELVRTAKDSGALVLLDAAQHVGHHPVDLRVLPVDYLAFSGHKCFGPTGIGVLFHRSSAPLSPWFVGGGTVRTATLENYTLLDRRERFEAGTPAIAEWIGLGAAIELISRIGYDAIESHDRTLVASMLKEFSRMPGDAVSLYGPKDAARKSCALFSFTVKGMTHHEVALMLDKMDFAVRSGHHCAMPLTHKLGVEGTVRASLHAYNSLDEVRKFGQSLEKITALA